MAGIRGKSGLPGNQNAFSHGLAGIAQGRADGVLNPAEQSIQEEILSGLLEDKGGEAERRMTRLSGKPYLIAPCRSVSLPFFIMNPMIFGGRHRQHS